MTRKTKSDPNETRTAPKRQAVDVNVKQRSRREAPAKEHKPWVKGELPRREDGSVIGRQRKKGEPALNPGHLRTEQQWTARQLREAARKATPGLFDMLKGVAHDDEQPAAARIAAANAMMDRGYGKAAQPVEHHQGSVFEEMDLEDLDGYIFDGTRELIAEKRADGVYEIAPGGAGKPKKDGK